MFNRIHDKNLFYLLFIGLIYRLIVFIGFYTHITIFPDSAGYIELSNLISSFELEGYNGKRSPGYPFLISLAFGNLYLLVIYQFFLGSITTLFWYKTLLNFNFNKKTSFVVSLFLMSFIHVLFYETAVLVETLALFLLSGIILILSSGYFKSNSYKWEFILGVLLGFLVLVKPFYAYLPFLIYGAFLFKNISFKNIINKKIIIFIFPLLSYFGWSYVNKLNTGHFVSTTFYGLNTAQNCVYFVEKGPEKYNWIIEPYVEYRQRSIEEDKTVAMSIWYAYNQGAFEKYNLNFADFSKELGEFAKLTIQANPLDYLKQVVFGSWIDFWKPNLYWNYDSFNFNGANKIFLIIWYFQKSLLYILKIAFVIISPFLILKWIRKKEVSFVGFLSLFVLTPSILQALLTYGTNSRFSYPFEFLMIIVLLLFVRENMNLIKKNRRILP